MAVLLFRMVLGWGKGPYILEWSFIELLDCLPSLAAWFLICCFALLTARMIKVPPVQSCWSQPKPFVLVTGSNSAPECKCFMEGDE